MFDDVGTLLPAGERLGHPGDREVDVAVGELGLRHDLDAALDDGDVEAHVLVEALVEGGVVAGELRLGEPLQLQAHLVGGLAVGHVVDRHQSSRCRPRRVVAAGVRWFRCRRRLVSESGDASSSLPHAATTSDSATARRDHLDLLFSC